VVITLSLIAAAAWGAGDFLGGLASRHGRVFAASTSSQAIGVLVALVAAPLIGGSPSAEDFAWGAVAGVSGGLAVLALYRGMATSPIGIVVPVAAIGTGGFPALFSVVRGEEPGLLVGVGLAVAAVALWFLSRPDGVSTEGTITSGLAYGLMAGAGFGGLLIALSRVGDDAGIWPLTTTRLSGAIVIALIAVISRRPLQPVRAALPAIAGAATLAIVGNAAFLFAATDGTVAIAAIIGALFPAFSVLLARIFLQEPLTSARLAGLGMAAASISLIALA
jgi:drug/metabolite transporter (DMT)-like permease